MQLIFLLGAPRLTYPASRGRRYVEKGGAPDGSPRRWNAREQVVSTPPSRSGQLRRRMADRAIGSFITILESFNELFLNPTSFGLSFSPSAATYRSTPAPFLTPSYGREIPRYQGLKVLRYRSDGMNLALNLPCHFRKVWCTAE